MNHSPAAVEAAYGEFNRTIKWRKASFAANAAVAAVLLRSGPLAIDRGVAANVSTATNECVRFFDFQIVNGGFDPIATASCGTIRHIQIQSIAVHREVKGYDDGWVESMAEGSADRHGANRCSTRNRDPGSTIAR